MRVAHGNWLMDELRERRLQQKRNISTLNSGKGRVMNVCVLNQQ